jgi:hypothetical protein
MLLAPSTGQLWSTVAGFVTAGDGYAYLQDLGRFGPPNSVSMFNDDTTRVQVGSARTLGPAGPEADSPLFGFPPGTSALGVWNDHPTGTTPVEVIYDPSKMPAAFIVWPGFTRDDTWLVSYQGFLPGLSQRRAVLGLLPSGSLYLAVQDAVVPAPGGTLPADQAWVVGAFVASPDLGIHDSAEWGDPGDIAQFLLDVDPCPSTRPNWIPAGGSTPVYDPTKPPVAHETPIQAFAPVAPELLPLYPGGALQLGRPTDPAMLAEYTCLVTALTAMPGRVLTAFRNNPPNDDYVRGAWIRAGGLLLVGQSLGYAGRPRLDFRYDLAWQLETGISGESLVLARKARRFYYPSVYDACPAINPDCYASRGYPEMSDPMQPGPVIGFRLGRFCPTGVSGCNDRTSPPARDAGISFTTVSGVLAMSRRPTNTSGGTSVTSFDKSLIPGLEYLGRVFYSTFVGDALFMAPPGLDVGQATTIR